MSQIPNAKRLAALLFSWAVLIVFVGCPGPDTSTPAEQPTTDEAADDTTTDATTTEDTATPDAAATADEIPPGVVTTDELKIRPPAPLKKAELLVVLPEECNTPDGMCLLPDGSVIVSVPNFNGTVSNPDYDYEAQPAVLMKVTPENKLELFYTLPVHPETKKAGPMGVCAAPSGDLYLADNQYFYDPDHKSRLVRIAVKDGKPVDMVTVVSGFNVSNAVTIREGYVYVSETIIDLGVKPMISGVYRFKLGEEGVQLKPGTDDPHLIATIQTHHEKIPFGADGLTFDSKGNLYVGNFADGTVHKIEFDEQGRAQPPTIFAKTDFMRSADGLFCDTRSDKIYVADSVANAVQVVSPDGTVQTLAADEESDGADGRLDQPCEVLLRGNEVIVANMDFPVEGGVNTKFEMPNTLSVIKLD